MTLPEAIARETLPLLALEDLHQVALTLNLNPGPWSEDLFELDPFPGIRRHLVAAEQYDWGASLDDTHALALAHQARFSEGEELLDEALAVYPEDRLVYASLLLTLHEIQRAREQWTDSLDTLDRADELIGRIEDLEADPYSLHVRGRFHGLRSQLEVDLGRPDHAWRQLERETELAQHFRSLVSKHPQLAGWEPLASDAEGLALYRRNELRLLLHRYEDIVDDLERTTVSYANARPHLGMALAQLELQSPSLPPRGRAILADAAQESTDPGARLIALFPLAHFDLARGDHGRAAESLEAIELALAESPAALSNSRQVAFVELLRTRLARLRGDPSAVLEEHLAALEGAWQKLLDSWSTVPLLPGGVGFLHMGRRGDILGEIIASCAALEQPERALASFFGAQTQGTLSRQLGLSAPTIETVQRTLVGDGGLLLYLPTRTRTDILLLDAGGLEYGTAVGDLGLQGLVADFEFEAKAGRVGAAGQTLGAALLPEPIRRRLEPLSHIYLVGTEFFGSPPIELLPYGDGALGSEKPVAYLPSVPLGVHLASGQRGPTSAGAGCAAIVAAPIPGEAASARWTSLVPIPEQLDVSRRLSQPFDRPALIAAERATPSAMGALELTEARLLHVFAHGEHEDERDLPQCLVLSEEPGSDGILRSEDIRALNVPELVILSACGSAWGQKRMGEDSANHLGGAFFLAGASTVVQARVPLAAGATLRTMEHFQARLVEGQAPIEAMRLARKAAAPEDAITAARLFVLGPAHTPLFERAFEPEHAHAKAAPGSEGDASNPGSVPTWVWVAVCGALAAAAGWSIARKRAA